MSGIFDSNMAEALDQSFSLEKLEINEIEECASVPNFENLNHLFTSQQLHSEKEAETFAHAEKSRPVLFKCLPRWKFAMPE